MTVVLKSTRFVRVQLAHKVHVGDAGSAQALWSCDICFLKDLLADRGSSSGLDNWVLPELELSCKREVL